MTSPACPLSAPFSDRPAAPASPTPRPGQVPVVAWQSARLPDGVNTCPSCDDGETPDQCICVMEEETRAGI
ncbi:hypothetical protein MXD60_24235 [Frankia sp. AgB32]|nr:hypothetical protein [Frankia sp. AgB32]